MAECAPLSQPSPLKVRGLWRFMERGDFAHYHSASCRSAHDPVAVAAHNMQTPMTMRATYLIYALISLIATAVIWAFFAGWAGGVAFLPDVALLTSGEWLSWAFVVALMYGPIAYAGWMMLLAIRSNR